MTLVIGAVFLRDTKDDVDIRTGSGVADMAKI
jgi:hypothetical protein